MHLFSAGYIYVIVCLLASVKKKKNTQQLEKKAATRVLSSIKKAEHITSFLKSLHWLPILLLTY